MANQFQNDMDGDNNGIIYPPLCQLIDLNSDEDITVDRLRKVFEHFLNFHQGKEDICKYISLWSHMNETFYLSSSPEIKILCTAIGAKICQCFLEKKTKYEKPFLVFNYQQMFLNLCSIFQNSFYCEDKNYVINYHILEVFVRKGLFKLNKFRNYLYVDMASTMLEEMFEQLLNLYIMWRNHDNVKNLIVDGLNDLFESGSQIVSPRNFLRITLMPLVTGSATIRFLLEKILKNNIKISHLKTFTELTAQSIALKKNSRSFNGKELKICEKLINMQNKSTEFFDSLLFVITKEVLNKHHPQHEEVTALLMASLVLMCKQVKGDWNEIKLETKRKIILMVLKLKQILIGPMFYPKLLVRYGPQLLENAPIVEIKYHYFEIFKHYSQHSTGDDHAQIVKLFDKYLAKEDHDVFCNN